MVRWDRPNTVTRAGAESDGPSDALDLSRMRRDCYRCRYVHLQVWVPLLWGVLVVVQGDYHPTYCPVYQDIYPVCQERTLLVAAWHLSGFW